MKKIIGLVCFALVLSFVFISVSMAVEPVTKENVGQKAKNFGKKIFNYPASVTKESVAVVADTAKRGTEVVTKEVERTGEVVTGDVAKTKEMVTEPITGTAETAVKAVEGTINVPVEAAKAE
jgi:hypothetical protein